MEEFRPKIIKIKTLVFFIIVLLGIKQNGYSQTWQELNDTLIILFTKENYTSAIVYAENALQRAEVEFSKTHENYETALNNLGILFETIGQYEKALPLYLEILKNTEKTRGKLHSNYTIFLGIIASIYKKTGKYENSLELYLEALNYGEKSLGKDHSEYGNILNDLADLYQKMGQYDKALPLMFEALENTEKSLGKNHLAYGVRLNNLAFIYKDIGKYEKALELYLECLENAEKTVGKNHPDYGVSLHNLAELYLIIGNYDTALKLSLEALENTEKSLGKSHPDYGTRLNNLASIHKHMGEYTKAEMLFLESMKNAEMSIGKSHPHYGIILNNLGELYWIMGQNNKALLLYLEALENTEKSLGKSHPAYNTRLNNLAALYTTTGKYDKALPMFLEALENTEKTVGKDHPDYGTRLNNLASSYETIGQYEKALPLYIEALENTEKTVGKDHSFYGTLLNNFALFYESIGQYDKALPLYLESVQNTAKSLGRNHSEFGLRLNNLAGLYVTIGQYDEAMPLYLEALDNTEKSLGKNHYNYGVCLNNLAELNSIIGNYDTALQLHLESLESTERSLGRNHSEYGMRLSNLALLFEAMGQHNKAQPLCLEALDIIEKSLGKSHAKYGICVNNLGLLYQAMDENEKALSMFLESQNNIKGQLTRSFLFLSESQKEQFLKTVDFNFKVYQSFFIRYCSTQPKVAAHAYDIELMTKNMILQAETKMRRDILDSGKNELLAKYDEWILLKRVLAQQYSQPLNERRSDIFQIEEVTEQLEAELTRSSHAFKKSEENKNVTWQNVRATLGHEDVAIEFASFAYRSSKEWTDSILYVALLLKHENDYPLMIPLFEERQLISLINIDSERESARVNKIYQDTQLYSLIWKSLEKYLKPNDNIYFSPAGFLNQINFNAIKDTDSTYLIDKYNFYQLGSTSDIKKTRENIGTKDIIVFGGMDYEVKETDISKALQNIPKNGEYVSRGLVIEDITRNGKWTYLPETKKEAENIYKISTNANITSKLFTGAEALEEQFKSLNGEKSPTILHVATHGFFFPDPKISKEQLEMMSFQRDNPYSLADNPMNRSGLLFSGSNSAWVGDSISLSREDGILTAYEASQIYLKNTELIVLSACKTGLGDIKGSEGVYGLQRAFKMAGVRYLLMSLWKVPDQATQEFMTEFYTELLTNKESIRSAYQKSQSTMKKKYRNEPYKWAGFVLME